MPSALNNIAVIYHFQGETAEQEGRLASHGCSRMGNTPMFQGGG